MQCLARPALESLRRRPVAETAAALLLLTHGLEEVQDGPRRSAIPGRSSEHQCESCCHCHTICAARQPHFP
jgi:hypothetical protein